MTGGQNELPLRGVLRPGIRTYKPRRSRITRRESAALETYSRYRVVFSDEILDLGAIWGDTTPVVLEIGFGSGAATAAMAAADPGVGILAVDIHTPGVGDLLDLAGTGNLANVRVM